MPLKEVHVLDQRVRFIAEVLNGELPFSTLCRTYGISRTTGYTYLNRYTTDGPAGLADNSRVPHNNPQAMSKQIEEDILELRSKHSTWGPVKLRARLCVLQPNVVWPVASTIGDLLRHRGLCKRNPRRGAASATPTRNLTQPTDSNVVWTIDFKGWFLMLNQQRCQPLTLADASTRFLLRCQALASTEGNLVKPVIEAAFREYGLPQVIRSDNGAPFASTGVGGLSRLGLWWLKLGIIPEHIRPGHPEENGRHERFHRTLKADLQLTTNPADNLRAQQKAFTDYRKIYNEERPHAALDNRTPAQLYTASPRPYTNVLQKFEYPAEYTERLIHTNGYVKWQGEVLYIGEMLCGEHVGIRSLTDRHWLLRVGPLTLAVRDTAEQRWLKQKEANKLLILCEEDELK